LADLPQLIATVQLSGLNVTLHESGETGRHIAEGAELVLYRIVQEALTNVSRHAGNNASATVTLTWRDTGVSVTVDDDGEGTTGPHHAGRVRVGMRERTALYDGSRSARPNASGGFRVHSH